MPHPNGGIPVKSLRRILIPILMVGAGLGCSSTVEGPAIVANRAPDEPALVSEIPTKDIPEQRMLDPNRIVARVNDQIITVRTIRASPYGAALLSLGDTQSEDKAVGVLSQGTFHALVQGLAIGDGWHQ